jgi:hypothetical protein
MRTDYTLLDNSEFNKWFKKYSKTISRELTESEKIYMRVGWIIGRRLQRKKSR